MAHRQEDRRIGDLFRASLRSWSIRRPRRMAFALKVAWRFWRQQGRRVRSQEALGIRVPYAIALSPTMRCNYNCGGCYSRGRSAQKELDTQELDALMSEAEGLGIMAFVLLGGEPLLRLDMPDLMERHKMLLFVMITNGALLTPPLARRIARSGNVVTLISLEGDQNQTDTRRGNGAHTSARAAMDLLRQSGGCFGFAGMVTAANAEYLCSEGFLDEMHSAGCGIGYFAEYVPTGPCPREDWVLEEPEALKFRQKILDLRRRKPLVLIQFPYDEYGPDNMCTGAGKNSLHISPQGDIQACPFIANSDANIRQGGLAAALRSPFMKAIRENTVIRRRGRYGCALFEHGKELDALAEEFNAQAGSGDVHAPEPSADAEV